MKSKLQLPKTLYIRLEVDGDDSYYVPENDLRSHLEQTETRLVGTYQLINLQEISSELKAVPVNE